MIFRKPVEKIQLLLMVFKILNTWNMLECLGANPFEPQPSLRAFLTFSTVYLSLSTRQTVKLAVRQ
jgi:hypothetical protein